MRATQGACHCHWAWHHFKLLWTATVRRGLWDTNSAMVVVVLPLLLVT